MDNVNRERGIGFAVQAGREPRVLVNPGRINDEQAFSLARNTTLKIQNNLPYPGQIKVIVIGETRSTEVAK
jgi:ribonuclease Y